MPPLYETERFGTQHPIELHGATVSIVEQVVTTPDFRYRVFSCSEGGDCNAAAVIHLLSEEGVDLSSAQAIKNNQNGNGDRRSVVEIAHDEALRGFHSTYWNRAEGSGAWQYVVVSCDR